MKRSCFAASVLALGFILSLFSCFMPGSTSCLAVTAPGSQTNVVVNGVKLGAGPFSCETLGTEVPEIRCGTNGLYKVYVKNRPPPNLDAGQYTVGTGSEHPAGPDQSALTGGGGGYPESSFLTIRVYNRDLEPTKLGIEYVQGSDAPQFHEPTEGYQLGSLGSYVVIQADGGTVTPIGPAGFPTGFATTYEIPAPVNLQVTQVVNVNGTTYEDSTVEVTTRVKNTGANDVKIGIRYRWDLAIGYDDGPTLQPYMDEVPAGGVLETEVEYAAPQFVMYRLVDNDMNPEPPTYHVFATNTGPSWVRPKPTPPAVFKYSCFYKSVSPVFESPITPNLCIASTADSCCGNFNGGDAVILYYVGQTEGEAITVKAGEEYQMSESLLVTSKKDEVPPHPEPPHPPAPVPALSGISMISFTALLIGIAAIFLSRKRKCEGRP